MKENLGFGFLGNGITVWDASRIQNNDYLTVAHIHYDRTVEYLEELSPEAIRRIEDFAKYENLHPVSQPDMSALKPLQGSVAITDDEEEIVEVWTTPQTNPKIFRKRVKSLMMSGLSQQDAERIASTEPMKLELFYDVQLGSFAIDAEAVGNTPLFHPYTGEEIPDETA